MGNKKQSGGGADPIDPSQEYQDIFNIFQKQVVPGYRKFVRNEPLLAPLRGLALQGVADLPKYTKMINEGYLQGQEMLPQAIDWLKEQYGSRVPTEQLTGPLMGGLRYLTPILASGGALPEDEKRRATQEAAARNAAAGMATSNPGIFAEALNRTVFKQNRFGQAVNNALGLTSGISGLDTQGLQNAISAGGTLAGYGNQLFQRPLQYALGLQGLRGSTMQDLAAAEGAQISSFGGLFNPTAAGVGSMLSFNANAALARENAQSQKKSNTTGAVIGAVGSIAAAY